MTVPDPDDRATDQSISIRREITVPASIEECWAAITDAGTMSRWYSGTHAAAVTCDPAPGGAIDIRWADGSHVGGEVVASTPPSEWVVCWWDAGALASRGDRGMITTQYWQIDSCTHGESAIRLTETGYDRRIVDEAWLHAIERGWDEFFGNLKTMLTPQKGESK